jgi:hypothetical protein
LLYLYVDLTTSLNSYFVLCCSYCATSRKVAGSILDGVIGNCH